MWRNYEVMASERSFSASGAYAFKGGEAAERKAPSSLRLRSRWWHI
jgi:hypothetical protein